MAVLADLHFITLATLPRLAATSGSSAVGLRRRQAATLVELISTVGTRQMATRTTLAERLVRLDARAAAAEHHRLGLEQRLAEVEAHLERLSSTLAERRSGAGIAVLAQQLEILRTSPTRRQPATARTNGTSPDGYALARRPRAPSHAPGNHDPLTASPATTSLAPALIFLSCMLLLWLLLWQLALALGLT